MKKNVFDKPALIRLRLENADETLQAAHTLYEHNASPKSIVNRAYYAMFYAASALAVSRGKAFTKHSGILTFIHKECVQTGMLDRKHGRAFQKAFEDRSEGDYQDMLKLTAAETAAVIVSAEDFVNALTVLVTSEPTAIPGHDQEQ